MPIPRSLLSRQAPTDHDLTVTRGHWPDELTGELVISAPHPSTFDGPHPFFGEGMVYRLSLQPGRQGAPAGALAWRQAIVDSPSARLRAKRPDLFEATMVGVRSPFGSVNAANTAPLPWGDRLFLTWDAGRPVEVDPVSLRYLGDVGHRSGWLELEMGPQPVLPFVMSTAHPVIDPEREVLWTVNLHWGTPHIVRWDGASGTVDRWPVEGAIVPQSVHTITQTRDWLVVADCAFKVEPQVFAGGARTEPANASGPVHLIRKADLEATPPGQPVAFQTFEMAPENNHYYANWDDSDGITILFEHTECADIAMVQKLGDTDALGRPCDPALAGLYGFPMAPDRTTLLTFDPESGQVVHRAELRMPDLLWTRQLNAMDWSTEGRSDPTVHHTVHQGFRPEAITQEMLALYGDRVDRTVMPSAETTPKVVTTALPDLEVIAVHELAMDDFPTSPIFVPRDPGADPSRSRHAGSRPGGHDGFIVVPILNDDAFRVEVFDAADVGRGPLAVASSPGMHVPFLLHAAWMTTPVTSSPGPGNTFADELDQIGELPDDLADVVLEVARELEEGVPL
jgi:all-trans-8'-apo-beta-carotenal 15,15'-oxygenase